MLDFAAPRLFQMVSLRRVAVGWAVLRVCSVPAIVNPMLSRLSRRVGDTARLSYAIDPFVIFSRYLLFPHFCAGERLEDLISAREAMGSNKCRLLVDHSVEEGVDAADRETNLANKLELLRRCGELDGICGIPVKPTSLISPELLEWLTTVIAACGDGDDSKSSVENVDGLVERSLRAENSSMLQAFEMANRSLTILCNEAQRVGVPLFLDAEQSHRQLGTDYFARRLQARFNRPEGDASIDGTTAAANTVLFNTYQMYLKDSSHRLKKDLKRAQRDGYAMGVKLVRGAYILDERHREENPGDVVMRCKDEVDAAYDAASALVLNAIASSNPSASPALMLATHNVQSVRAAVKVMENLSISESDHRVQFAQILGMADHVTHALGNGGYNSSKLMLFGEFTQIFPWLLRRVVENGDILSAASQQREVELLGREIRRRLGLKWWDVRE